MNKPFDIQWKKDSIIAPEGIIIGCSQNQEWMLPWWWVNYSLHNIFPITILDFGDMSPQAIAWCKDRGNYVKLQVPDFLAKKQDVDPNLAAKWEDKRRQIWTLRPFWFNRILYFLETPYKKTIWIDLDCQVLKALNSIFESFLEENTFAIAPEAKEEMEKNRKAGILAPNATMYNAGVTAFTHGSEIIYEWVRRCVTENHLYMSTQPILADILQSNKFPFAQLPITYNWAMAQGYNPEAQILHYWGAYQGQILTAINHMKYHFYMDLGF